MILDLLLGTVQRLAFDEERFWADIAEGAGITTASGVNVTEATALNCSAVFRAVQLISGLVSGLPLHVYRRVSDDERERVSDHRLEDLLNDEPNDEMDGQTFRETLQSHTLLWGNGYAEIQRVGAKPVALWPLHPSRVRPERDKAGNIIYQVKSFDGTEPPRTLDASLVFHLKNIGSDGLAGWSTIRLARESLGLTAAMESAGAALFGNDSRPGGVLRHPGKLSPEAQKNLRESWERVHQGPNRARRLAVLTEGMEYSAIMMPPEDAQWMQGRKFQIEEVSRWFGVAPHLLFELTRSTNNNIEWQGLEFLVFCLGYWLVKWERACRRQLLLEAEKKELYLEHVTDALTRADIQGRYNAYATGRTNGWLSANDIRRRENQPPIGPEGDIYLSPANMLDAETLLEPPAPPPAPAFPPPNGKPAPGPNPTPTARMTADAHRALLADVLGRLLRKEMVNVRQAAKKPGEFLDWLDAYYPHHERLLAEAVTPVLEAWQSTGETGNSITAEQIAHRHCENSRIALLELAGNVTAARLVVEAEAYLALWEDRATAAAAEVIP